MSRRLPTIFALTLLIAVFALGTTAHGATLPIAPLGTAASTRNQQRDALDLPATPGAPADSLSALPETPQLPGRSTPEPSPTPEDAAPPARATQTPSPSGSSTATVAPTEVTTPPAQSTNQPSPTEPPARLTATPPALAASPTLPPATNPDEDSLTISSPAVSSFQPITLNGRSQITSASLASFVVSDLRLTSLGWHVTAQADRFSGPQGHPLPFGSLTMGVPDVVSVGEAPSLASGPYTLDTGAPSWIASSEAGHSTGTFTFSATDLTLTIPADAYAGTYQSTVTVSIISGP